jgi:hypothetical protein
MALKDLFITEEVQPLRRGSRGPDWVPPAAWTAKLQYIGGNVYAQIPKHVWAELDVWKGSPYTAKFDPATRTISYTFDPKPEDPSNV